MTIINTQGSIDIVQFHNLMVLILRATLLIFLLPEGAFANAADKSTKDAARVHYAWQQVVAELEEQRGHLSGNMQDALDVLLERAQKESPDLVARLYLNPPRRSGYQNIPTIKPDSPLAAVTPQTQTYSLEKLQKRFEIHLRASIDLDERVATFEPSTGLAIRTNGDGNRLLPVTVYTDINDEEFLDAFREGVRAAFNHSEAARKQRFTVRLEIHQLTVAELYPQGAPAEGSAINLKKHIALYPPGELILTTGGASTHAWMGRNVTLGPNPTTRRALAHEFGHLLGFSDAYLRSYQGDPQDPYGVIFLEWTGLVDNLMGSPGLGRVTDGMIETLINAYSIP